MMNQGSWISKDYLWRNSSTVQHQNPCWTGSRRNYADSKITTTPKSPPQPPPTAEPNPSILGQVRMTPTALDKIFLVWSGRFKSRDQIPHIVDGDMVLKARSFSRIRINIGFLIIAALGSMYMVYSGKQAAKRGEASVEQQNLDWHKKNKDDHNKQK